MFLILQAIQNFEAIDVNNDMKIDEKEATDYLQAKSHWNISRNNQHNRGYSEFRQEWIKMDLDSDGEISPREFDSSLSDFDYKHFKLKGHLRLALN